MLVLHNAIFPELWGGSRNYETRQLDARMSESSDRNLMIVSAVQSGTSLARYLAVGSVRCGRIAGSLTSFRGRISNAHVRESRTDDDCDVAMHVPCCCDSEPGRTSPEPRQLGPAIQTRQSDRESPAADRCIEATDRHVDLARDRSQYAEAAGCSAAEADDCRASSSAADQYPEHADRQPQYANGRFNFASGRPRHVGFSWRVRRGREKDGRCGWRPGQYPVGQLHGRWPGVRA